MKTSINMAGFHITKCKQFYLCYLGVLSVVCVCGLKYVGLTSAHLTPEEPDAGVTDVHSAPPPALTPARQQILIHHLHVYCLSSHRT